MICSIAMRCIKGVRKVVILFLLTSIELCADSAFGGNVFAETLRTSQAKSPEKFNYAEVLQKALFFFDAQRSGDLPAGFRVAWRGDSALDDGKEAGVDLSGGYYDAGDHMKFALPMTSALTLLAWGGIEYGAGFKQAAQWSQLLETIRWGTDWIMKAHPSERVFYGQVGDPRSDHSFWGPPEAMTMARLAFKIDARNPGSELAGEAAAALAAAGILFEPEDPVYAQRLLAHARALFDFADRCRGTYTDAIPSARGYYASRSGYYDELAWSALWLYKAIGDIKYLRTAESIYAEHLGTGVMRWTHSWDDKCYGAAILLAQLTKANIYRNAVRRWLNYWTIGDGGERITYTRGGLAWLDSWGSLRYAATTAFLAFVYADTVEDVGDRYRDFARRQIDYMLGANPEGRSYVVGFGNNSPRNPHHRAAHGSSKNSIKDPLVNRYILYGALVGGPTSANDSSYVDDRANFKGNEVALDYNAGFTGAVARMVLEFGGTPLVNFPRSRTPPSDAQRRLTPSR
jgi:endoglucanase